MASGTLSPAQGLLFNVKVSPFGRRPWASLGSPQHPSPVGLVPSVPQVSGYFPITAERAPLRFRHSHLSYQTQSLDEIWKELCTFCLEILFSLPLWKQLPAVYFGALGNLSWYFNLLKRLRAKPLRTNLLEGARRGRSARVNKYMLLPSEPAWFGDSFLQWSQQAAARQNSLSITVKAPKENQEGRWGKWAVLHWPVLGL